MPKQSLLGQVRSDQKRFASFSATEQLYTSREVGLAGGVSPGSSFKSGINRNASQDRR